MIERRAPWIAAILVLVVGVSTISIDPIGVFHDDGIYLLTAKALAEGHGFVYPNFPGLPPAIHYPPVWPALLALVWKVAPSFPESSGWFKMVNPVIIAAGAGGMVVAAQRLLGWPGWAALLATLVAIVSFPVLLLTTFLLSEPLFIALLFPTVLVCERMRREGGARWCVMAAVLTALLVLTRTIGISAFAAALLVLALERQWRSAATYAALTIVLLLPWQLFVWSASVGFPDVLRGSFGPYLEWVVAGYREGGVDLVWRTVAQNLRRLVGFAGFVVFPSSTGALRIASGVALLLVVSTAAVMLYTRDRARILVLATVGYVAIAVSWPFHIDRFLWAIWPPLTLITLAGWYLVIRELRTRTKAGLAVAVAFAGLVIVQHEVFTWKALSTGWRPEMSAERTAYGILLARAVNLEPRLKDKRVVSELAPLVALYAGDTIIPAEILTATQHLRGKSIPEHRVELQAIDAYYLPDAFVVLTGGPYIKALKDMPLAEGRTLRDVSAPRSFVRILMVERP